VYLEKIIGIDLGTSNSAAAVMVGGRPAIIPSAEGIALGGKMFPSYVAFTKSGELLVGEPARRQVVTNTDGTVMAIKRKMGTDYRVSIYGREYTPQQISAFILQKIRTDAEAFLGEPVKKAVITVPAYFNDNQRTATKEAGLIAGLEVIRIINEPTAASLAYGLDRADREQRVLVFDLGGGTLDVTIMDFGEGVFEVISTSGDTELGGTDMDDALTNHICTEFEKEHGIGLTKDRAALQRTRDAAEKAKIELSNIVETEITLPFISADSSGPKHLVMKLSRSKLEDIVRGIVSRCEKSVRAALDDARMKPSDIDRVILVGGPTRMPIVREFVESHFGKKAERGVDPMECVAIGAAIQGSVISGEITDILLLDVTPLSLGVETVGAMCTRVIDRNTTIPARKSQIFTTSQDNQVNVDINVLQGDRPMAGDNISLGKFTLAGLPLTPRGVPQVEVTFDIDANGILHVSAKDLATSKEQRITISGSTHLSAEQMERMKRETEQHAEDDKQKKEWAETKNRAESLIYETERAVAGLTDKVSDGDRKRLDDELKILKASMDGKNIGVVKEKTDALTALLHSITTEMYRKAAESRETDRNTEQDSGDKNENSTISAVDTKNYTGEKPTVKKPAPADRNELERHEKIDGEKTQDDGKKMVQKDKNPKKDRDKDGHGKE
jgi:molecular chaperone DnaK